jgi:hypothetical protein
MATPPSKTKYFVSGDPGDLSTNPTLPKAKEVVQIKEPTGALTLHDRRLFNLLVAHAQRDLTAKASTEDEHEISIDTLNLTKDGHHNSYDRIQESVERLQRTLVQWNDGTGWNSAQLLAPSRIHQGKLYWRFWRELVPYLAQPAQYARISLKVIYHLRSKYSVAFYENLMLYAKRRVKRWEVGLKDFREFLGVGKGEYEEFAQLKRRVIVPIIKEVSKFSPLNITWEERREKRAVAALVFHIAWKTDAEQDEAEVEQDVDLPLMARDHRILTVDTPQTRFALKAYLRQPADDQIRMFNVARKVQLDQDGVELIQIPMFDHPETWIHYLLDPAAAPLVPICQGSESGDPNPSGNEL